MRQRYPSLPKIVSSVVWLSADKVRLALSLVIGAWTARYLQPAAFGTLNYAGALIALLSVVTDLGMETVTVRNLVRNRDAAPTLLGTVFTLRLGAAILIYTILVFFVVIVVKDRELRGVTLILGASILIQPLLTPRYWFQAELSSKHIFVANNISFLVTTVLRVLLIVFHRPLIEFAWVMVCETLLTAFSLYLFFRQQGMRVGSWRFCLPIVREVLNDSWPLMLSGVAVTLYMRIDQVMLGAMLDSKEVGIYSAAVKVSEVWYFLPMVLASSLFPSIIRTREVSLERYWARLRQYFNLNVALAYALLVPMLFTAPWIVSLLYGEEYQEAHRILIIHLWAAIFVFLGVARDQFLIVEGFLRISLVATLSGAIANVTLNLVLIPYFHGVGAAIATVISYALAAVFSSFIFAKTRAVGWMQLRALLLPFSVARLRRFQTNDS